VIQIIKQAIIVEKETHQDNLILSSIFFTSMMFCLGITIKPL
jgi:hypothetical protein